MLHSIKWEGDCEWWIGKDAEGSGHDSFHGTIPALVSKDTETVRMLIY
jgi:hypothetical protein